MRKRVSCLAFGVGLAAGTLNAQGQTHGPTFVGQAPVAVPPSGVLVTQPPAPVAVPPSGVLVTQPTAKRHTVATVPIKKAQTVEVVERTAPTTMRRHVYHRTASRHVTTRTLVLDDLAAKHATTTAAATPAPAPPVYVPAPAPVYNWTGFYIGGNLGAGFTSGSFSDTLGSTFTNSSSTTFLGGGQVGVNDEFWGGVVVGAEAMFDWAPNQNNTLTATTIPALGTGGTATATINNRWLTTATGKLGYAWDRVLLYGKGGGAWVGQTNSNLTVGDVPFTVGNTSNTNWGWTAGVGVEWAFRGTWSARAEYDFVGLNNQNFTVTNGAGALVDTISATNRHINMVTAAVNYKFGPW
jgi:outer membrane immunogenic protein